MDIKQENLNVSDYPGGEKFAEEVELNDGGVDLRYKGTAADQKDMLVLGKKQVLRASVF